MSTTKLDYLRDCFVLENLALNDEAFKDCTLHYVSTRDSIHGFGLFDVMRSTLCLSDIEQPRGMFICVEIKSKSANVSLWDEARGNRICMHSQRDIEILSPYLLLTLASEVQFLHVFFLQDL